MKKFKLFCFPYAGGSSVIYEKWRKELSPSIELIPVEYAGRGTRFTTPPFTNINDVVEDAFHAIKKHLDTTSYYSFFGHSMGALIAYELSHKLIQLNFTAPVHIFFSGKLAPHIENEYKLIHNLEDIEFKEELLKLGGTPREALENKDWTKLFLPILRADFKAVEEYSYSKKNNTLPCDFTILYGQDDLLTANKIEEWQHHTKNKCTFSRFSGGHFFIANHVNEIVNVINDTLISKL